jgi:NAD(P)H-quinone oxidoreductase subunit 5
MQKSLRFVQDFCAYDFYVEKFYRLTVVAAVDLLSKMTSWFDRYVVDGLVNFAALATVFGGQSLKYSVSGQSQVYILTIMIGVGLLLVFSWIVGDYLPIG